MPAGQEQRAAFFRVAEGGVAAFFCQVIGFGFDDAGCQPQAVDPVADDFAEQFTGHALGVPLKETIVQGAGLRPGQTKDGIVGHGLSRQGAGA